MQINLCAFADSDGSAVTDKQDVQKPKSVRRPNRWGLVPLSADKKTSNENAEAVGSTARIED